jgi:nicotinate-nucleotide pyrophosphorylase (carboxylating)
MSEMTPAVTALIDLALEEDLGRGDVTSTAVLDPRATAEADLVARERLVVAGLPIAAAVFQRVDRTVAVELLAADGDELAPGGRAAIVRGRACSLLAAERTALNFVQRLSGIATHTRRFRLAVRGTSAEIVDTRKTTPGWRTLEKYAVRCGGGRNYRLALYDGILIKDNHIGVCGSIGTAVQRARAGAPVLTKIEVECDTLDQVKEALAAGADMILLDNMGLEDMRKAVMLSAGRVPLEASGGVRLETIRAVAETGVDFISVGRITQSAPAVDIGLDALIRT